jgi:hypothetical protein
MDFSLRRRLPCDPMTNTSCCDVSNVAGPARLHRPSANRPDRRRFACHRSYRLAVCEKSRDLRQLMRDIDGPHAAFAQAPEYREELLDFDLRHHERRLPAPFSPRRLPGFARQTTTGGWGALGFARYTRGAANADFTPPNAQRNVAERSNAGKALARRTQAQRTIDHRRSNDCTGKTGSDRSRFAPLPNVSWTNSAVQISGCFLCMRTMLIRGNCGSATLRGAGLPLRRQ